MRSLFVSLLFTVSNVAALGVESETVIRDALQVECVLEITPTLSKTEFVVMGNVPGAACKERLYRHLEAKGYDLADSHTDPDSHQFMLRLVHDSL